MHSVSVRIKSVKSEYSFELYCKYNYLSARSGIGKSMIKSVLDSSGCKVYVNNNSVDKNCIGYLTNSYINLAPLSSLYDKTLYILDEVDWLYRDDYKQTLKALDAINSIFIIIGRDSVNAPIPAEGVLDFIKKGNKHIIRPIKFR